jgi:hypothetical protein
MSFSGKTDGPDEATQHDFLDAERRWNADEKVASGCWTEEQA